MRTQKTQNHGTGTKVMHAGMWLCCAIMLLPIFVFFAGGGTILGLSNSLGVLAPILLCLGAHGAMFFLMGKSCHGDRKTAPTMLDAKPLPAKTTDI